MLLPQNPVFFYPKEAAFISSSTEGSASKIRFRDLSTGDSYRYDMLRIHFVNAHEMVSSAHDSRRSKQTIK